MTRLLLPTGLMLAGLAYLWLQRRAMDDVWREHCRSREDTGTEYEASWGRDAA